MSSGAPRSSGATVMTRRPSRNVASVVLGHVRGVAQQVGRVGAPLRLGEEGSLHVEAQRLRPVARGGRQPGPHAVGEVGEPLERRVTEVGRNEVTPCAARARAMPSSASGPPMAS